MSKLWVKIIEKGFWKRDDQFYNLYIIEQNWDYFYEDRYDNEPPDLNENDLAYYIIYGDFIEVKNANRSRTCLSKDEAIDVAESTILYKINWEKNFIDSIID